MGGPRRPITYLVCPVFNVLHSRRRAITVGRDWKDLLWQKNSRA